MKCSPNASAAFTLIELLIVVAIIAILAAIAVPNFLEAQTRAKVARVKAELRVLAGALEAYYIDESAYPPPASNGSGARLFRLSTPIAYISDPTRKEPFKDEGLITEPPYSYHGRNKRVNIFWNNDGEPGAFGGEAKVYWYVLRSAGPDNDRDGGAASALNFDESRPYFIRFIYDPTNGTTSKGDIWRGGGEPTGRCADSFSLMGQ